ncbi:MAG: DUF501 domain-containing protein [Motiliproteus sp.]
MSDSMPGSIPDTTTTEQLAVIEQQLGRPARGMSAIAYQSPEGVPMVLRMESLVDEKPFPTLYWLCSKDLHKAISRIETAGWVKLIEQELQQDEALRNRYLANHRDYVALRDRLMSEPIRRRIEQLGFADLFQQYGIGGISQWDKVRCLHMQYAHYLSASELSPDDNPQAGANVIGERMEQEFNLSQTLITI